MESVNPGPTEVVVVLKDAAGVERGRFKASPDKAAAAVAAPPAGMTATIVR